MGAQPGEESLLGKLMKYSDIGSAVAIVGIVGMLIVPLPPDLLDVLLAFNLACAIITVLISIYIEEPLQFAVFPTVLLVATLFRLALDVSATRMILLHGNEIDMVTKMPTGAGHLIPTFGQQQKNPLLQILKTFQNLQKTIL